MAMTGGGCELECNTPSARIDRLEKRIEELEREVRELKEQQELQYEQMYTLQETRG